MKKVNFEVIRPVSNSVYELELEKFNALFSSCLTEKVSFPTEIKVVRQITLKQDVGYAVD